MTTYQADLLILNFSTQNAYPGLLRSCDAEPQSITISISVMRLCRAVFLLLVSLHRLQSPIGNIIANCKPKIIYRESESQGEIDIHQYCGV